MNGPHVGDILAAGLATTVGAFIVVDFARFEELRVVRAGLVHAQSIHFS